MNQLLVLLNTAVAEGKEQKKADVARQEASSKHQVPASGVHDRPRPASGTQERGRLEREDSIEYQHGSLGLVPMGHS